MCVCTGNIMGFFLGVSLDVCILKLTDVRFFSNIFAVAFLTFVL